MAKLHSDGFGTYTTLADMLTLWTGASGASISAGNGSNGGPALALTTTNSTAYKYLGGLKTTLISHFYVKTTALVNDVVFHRYEDNGTTQVDFRMLSDGRIKVTRNGTLLANSVESVFATNTSVHIQTKVRFHDATGGTGVAGTFEVKANNNVLTWSAANTNINTLATANVGADRVALNGPGSGTTFYFDDFICLDTTGSAPLNDYLGTVSLLTQLANGPLTAPVHADWFNSANNHTGNWSYVEETPPNTGGSDDFVYATTLNDIDTYDFTDLSSAAGTVLWVDELMYAKQDVAGAQTNIAAVTRIGSTDYVGTTVPVPVNAVPVYLPRQHWPLSPATGLAWTIAEFNAAQFGLKRLADT